MTTTTLSTRVFVQEQPWNGLSMSSLIGCYFGLRVCLTYLFFQATPQTGAIVNVGLNLSLMLPVAIYAFGPAAENLRSFLKVRPIGLVLSFLALALVSLAWSETSSKSVAFGYWSAMASDVVLVLLLARTCGAAFTSEALLKGYVCGTVILCLVAWIAPAMQDLRLGDDEFLTPNAIGFECAFSVLICQYFASRGFFWRLAAVFAGLTLLRSLSKSSIAAFLIVEVFYLFRTNSISRTGKIKIAFGSLLVVAAFSSLIVRYYNIYINAGNQAETLTGRTSIWLVTFGAALEEPWFGHGFHAFRNVIPPFGSFQPWHAHNELLQQFFTYGVLGLVLILILYFSFYRLCRRQASHPFSLIGISLLILVLSRGIADTERFDISFPLWALTACSLLLSAPEAYL